MLLCLAACSAPPTAWQRLDGTQPSPEQLEMDTLACRGETEKAAVQGQSISTISSAFGADRHDLAIYKGCMAARGYLALK